MSASDALLNLERVLPSTPLYIALDTCTNGSPFTFCLMSLLLIIDKINFSILPASGCNDKSYFKLPDSSTSMNSIKWSPTTSSLSRLALINSAIFSVLALSVGMYSSPTCSKPISLSNCSFNSSLYSSTLPI